MKNQELFIKKVIDGFSNCGVDFSSCNRIGVAVSGGADSVSMLLASKKIFGENIFAITVNHNIRPSEETNGDAEFVLSLCKKLHIPCELYEIERGKIDSLSTEMGGTESAARFLRYSAFEKFIEKYNLDYLCLAHNQNDQLETSLMRFLQGSGTDGGGGIAIRREKYIRPLLNISRSEIESFLESQNQEWRTDATNLDDNYLRNKIRNILIPQLDELFSGWRKAVLNGVEKNSDDNFYLSKVAKNFVEKMNFQSEKSISCKKELFYKLDSAIKRRVIQSSLSKIGYKNRFPYKLIREITSWNENQKKHSVQFENILISTTDTDFSIEIADFCENVIETGFFEIRELQSSNEKKKIIFRSIQNGDEIRMKDGKNKSVSKILSEWKVSKNDKEKIVIVQDSISLENVAILGKSLGYKDWIISDCGFCFSSTDI